MTSFKILPPVGFAILPRAITVWTKRDYDILQTLAIRLRLLSLAQVMRIWWPGQKTLRNARRRLRQLVAARLLKRFLINAHPLLEPTSPFGAWHPGEPAPDSRILSEAARRRWNQRSIPTEVFTASKQTANLFGGDTPGLPKLEQRDHDLLLADVYVAYRQNRPSEAARWIGEDFLPKAGFRIKDPDAFLIDQTGRPDHVIESAGRYSAKQIAAFHDHCESLQLSYELW